MIKTKNLLLCSNIKEVLGDKKNLSDSYLIGTDSRNFEKGSIFLAIKGERFDGFSFVDKVLDKTNLIICESTQDNKVKAQEIISNNPDKVIVLVENSISFTQELASHHVQDWLSKGKREIIAISGSNGKTTTKEMLWHVLSSINSKNVICTQKNNNNHLGVPFTLFQISDEIDYAIVEYGSNHPGEMKTICDCSHPTMGITTNIGDTHMEFFNDLEAVFKEESLIHKYIKNSKFGKKIFFKNNDDSCLSKILNADYVKSFGLKSQSDFNFKFLRADSSIRVNETLITNKNILGEHNFVNLACAFVISQTIYPDKTKEILNATSSFQPTKNRSQWLKWKNSRVFLDAYNANPSSMKLAAKEFYSDFLLRSQSDAKCLMVIGDMNELGDKAPKYHEELGDFFRNFKRADVVFMGRYLKYFQTGYKEDLLISSNDPTTLAQSMEQLQEYSDIFVKASRSLQLESVFAIKERST